MNTTDNNIKSRLQRMAAVLLMLIAVTATGLAHEPDVTVTLKRGDVSGDGQVNGGDLSLLTDHLLGRAKAPSPDVNGDGTANIADVTALVALLLAGPGSDDLPLIDSADQISSSDDVE